MFNKIQIKENKFKAFKIIIKKINKSNVNTKNIRKIIMCGAFMFIMLITFGSIYGIGDPTLVTKINSALKKIQGYLIKFSTPAAGVAIASGVLMRKFSFGNEEKMAIGKKIIVNAIIGYAIVLSIDLIIKFVDTLI